jgi:hypothetical protein
MASNFKEQLAQDLALVFFNIDEFAELHTINSAQLNIVIDNDKLKERQTKAEYGYNGDILFYVQKSVYGDAPAIGQIVKFDGEVYRVSDFHCDNGMYSITLAANMS